MSENDTDQQDPIGPEESGSESLSRRRLVLGGLAAAATVAVATASLGRASPATGLFRHHSSIWAVAASGGAEKGSPPGSH